MGKRLLPRAPGHAVVSCVWCLQAPLILDKQGRQVDADGNVVDVKRNVATLKINLQEAQDRPLQPEALGQAAGATAVKIRHVGEYCRIVYLCVPLCTCVSGYPCICGSSPGLCTDGIRSQPQWAQTGTEEPWFFVRQTRQVHQARTDHANEAAVEGDAVHAIRVYCHHRRAQPCSQHGLFPHPIPPSIAPPLLSSLLSLFTDGLSEWMTRDPCLSWSGGMNRCW